MPNNKSARLASNVVALTVVLRQKAEQAIKERGSCPDPLERSQALGYAAALDYCVEKLDELISAYLTTVELSD